VPQGSPREIISNLVDNMYYTYVLQSEKDGLLYTGYTKNLKLRFELHNRGQVTSTKHRQPLKLIYYEACMSSEDATRREKYLKTHYGKMYLKKRLVNWFENKD